ncbi:hypothetical protein [Aquitalea magnusonii]|uniref:Uncharacterized protein n=1 Tax=Aquitalea magnusonii TaxID=332411 RepID=A0A318JPZ2_9NEIS|nr:hypothetical protein [Aquitalea magnusonii]PXX51199.1 hypothetical protein DFR38_101261 [Aquitalea magnusonii]
MMRRKFPWCEFSCSPTELVRAVCFGDLYTVASECGLQPDQLGRWRSGREPVPKWAFILLSGRNSVTLPASAGPWRGFRVSDDGLLLECPATRVRLRYEDVAMMPEYRKAHRLVQEQAELIERLMMERDFYRRNCHHQAKYGALLYRLFPDE